MLIRPPPSKCTDYRALPLYPAARIAPTATHEKMNGTSTTKIAADMTAENFYLPVRDLRRPPAHHWTTPGFILPKKCPLLSAGFTAEGLPPFSVHTAFTPLGQVA